MVLMDSMLAGVGSTNHPSEESHQGAHPPPWDSNGRRFEISISPEKGPRTRGPFSGANYRIRTCDLLITNQLLYQLS